MRHWVEPISTYDRGSFGAGTERLLALFAQAGGVGVPHAAGVPGVAIDAPVIAHGAPKSSSGC